MSLIFGVVSQKGGVGKSTLARLLAREYAYNEWSVKIADMDTDQGTSVRWVQKRQSSGRKPEIAAEPFRTVDAAKKNIGQYDLIIFDGAPHATQQTDQIAKICDLIILPTSHSIEDMEPAVTLAHKLKKQGVPRNRILIAFSRVGDSKAEEQEAIEYIQKSGYDLLNGAIPERTAFRRALELGASPTETLYSSLNKKADLLVGEISKRARLLEDQGELKHG